MIGEIKCPASLVARILERLLAEKSCARIKDWRAIADAHGYPSVNAMRDMLAQLRPLGDLEVWFEIADDTSVPTSNPDAYGCECGREFGTPQGLGIHRSRSRTHIDQAARPNPHKEIRAS